MKKLLKIGIFLFLAAVVLSVALIFILKNKEMKPPKIETPQFDRAALDANSVFKDFVFEQQVRTFLNLPEGEIDTASLAGVKDLDISVSDSGLDEDHKISSLYGLKFFTGLESLTVNNSVAEYIDPITSCESLKKFTSRNSRFMSAEPLGQLKGLTYIDLKNTRIQDSSFLKNLTNLEYLRLSQTEIAGVSVLAENSFPNLRELYVDGTGIIDLYWIYKVSSLVVLDISNNDVINDENLKGIESLVNLEYFNGSSQSISDVSIFAKLPKLKTLNLSINKIQDASPLAACKNLEELNLNSNMLTSIDGLKGLKTLKKLYVKNNQISQFTVLDSLNLEECDISGNLGNYNP